MTATTISTPFQDHAAERGARRPGQLLCRLCLAKKSCAPLDCQRAPGLALSLTVTCTLDSLQYHFPEKYELIPRSQGYTINVLCVMHREESRMYRVLVPP
jgi:hypothetical protein